MELHTYLLFIGAIVLLVLAPGPDMAYMLARTALQGRRAGVIAAIGINVGAYVHTAAAVFGLTALLASSAVAFSFVKLIGALYLIWLGIEAFTSKQSSTSPDSLEEHALSGKAIFWRGFLSDVLNPKVAIFNLAFLPQFVDTTHSSLNTTQQLLLLGVTGNVVAVCINLSLVCLASMVADRVRRSHVVTTWLNRAVGALFVGLGIRIAHERL